MLCVRPWVCCIFPVSCVFARMHENAKVYPPGQRGIARPPWYGGDLQTGFLLERPGGGGRLSGSFRGAAACVPGVWVARRAGMVSTAICLMDHGCEISLQPRQASTCLGSRTTRQDSLPPTPPSAHERHDDALLRRMGVETAYLVPGGAPSYVRHGTYMGERLENAFVDAIVPLRPPLFQLVESTGRQMGGGSLSWPHHLRVMATLKQSSRSAQNMDGLLLLLLCGVVAWGVIVFLLRLASISRLLVFFSVGLDARPETYGLGNRG